MKQWIIDRYNKGQDKYFLYYDNEYFIKYLHEPEKSRWDEAVLCCVEYILYSKDIGFAKAFWGDEVLNCEWCEKNGTGNFGHCSAGIMICNVVCYVYKYRLLYMAIAPDPLEYLEQFKD
jgi:hypothetical protein